MTLNDLRGVSDEYASERARLVPFSRENGVELLSRHFEDVVCSDVDQSVMFPDAATVRGYQESTILLGHGAGRVPDVDGPIRAGARTTVFVATKAG